jgi:hypothetical protein
MLLREVLDRRTDGMLQLVDERAQRHAIVLRSGAPIALESRVAVEPLTRTLLRLGLLTRPQCRQLDNVNTTEEALCRHLVDHEMVSSEALRHAKRHRLMLRLERLFSLGPNTRYVVRRDRTHKRSDGMCNAVALLMRGFRRLGQSARAIDVLHYVGEGELVLRRDDQLRQLGLTRIERAIVDHLGKQPQTLGQIESLGLGPRPVVKTAIYALVELRYVTRAADQEPADPVTMPEAIAARSIPPVAGTTSERALVAAPVHSRQQLRERLAVMDRQTYFDMLGVAVDATFDEVRAAHVSLLYIWHPDRMPPGSATDDGFRDDLVEICRRLDQACGVLTHHDRRAAYVAFLREQVSPVAAPVDAQPTTSQLLERAERAFRGQRVDEAEGLLVRLCSLDRHHLQARALLAWIQAGHLPAPRLRGGQRTRAYAEPLAILDDVVRADPNLERARYWRGVLLKRSGYRHAAWVEFRAVVKLNPRNVGAEREVRNYELQRQRACAVSRPR